MQRGMRFDPPAVALPRELAWLLAAAFGRRLPPLSGDAGRAAELAQRFDLGPRIVAFHGGEAVGRRLGDAAAPLVRAHRQVVAVAMAAERAALEIARLAARAALPVIFLKGHALLCTAPGPAGWRPLVDLDVLLAPGAAERLRDSLLADGWAAAEEADNPHHLAPLTGPERIPVDIHYRLRGIRVAEARWATADELLAGDLCRPAEFADGAWLPRPPLLAAHLAVHAIEQHGHRPGSYPLLRAVADLADLAALEGEEALAPAAQLARGDLSADELQALKTLGRLLGQGRTPRATSAEERDAERLLRHVVAGVLDPDYRRSLALAHTAGRLRQARRDGDLMRYIAHKLKGPAKSTLLYPIQLGARFASAAAARLRQALHR